MVKWGLLGRAKRCLFRILMAEEGGRDSVWMALKEIGAVLVFLKDQCKEMVLYRLATRDLAATEV
jgi:hypothetical protein